MTVTRVWASGLLLGLLVSGGVSFNLDVNLPVIKQGQTDSFFGYSLAQHRNFKDTSQGTILVGAPRWVWHIFRNFQTFFKSISFFVSLQRRESSAQHDAVRGPVAMPPFDRLAGPLLPPLKLKTGFF